MSLPRLPNDLRAVIADLGGTMVDTLGDFVGVLNTVLTELTLPPVGRAFVEHTVGKGCEHLNRSTPIEVGAAVGLYASAWALYQPHYAEVNGAYSSVYPRVIEGLLHFTERGLRLARLTNKPSAFSVPLLRQNGLDGFFSAVFSGDVCERKKPDPLPLLKTCEALGSAPGRTLMLCDSSHDARAARAAGCRIVPVSDGCNHGAPVLAVDTDGVIDRLGIGRSNAFFRGAGAEMGCPAP